MAVERATAEDFLDWGGGMRGSISRLMVLVALGSLAPGVNGASDELDVSGVKQKVRAYRVESETSIIQTFRDFLSLPNVSNIPTNAVDMDRNATWIVEYLAERDFMSEVVKAGRAPYVIASRSQPGP